LWSLGEKRKEASFDYHSLYFLGGRQGFAKVFSIIEASPRYGAQFLSVESDGFLRVYA
jgi:hypothetical protein